MASVVFNRYKAMALAAAYNLSATDIMVCLTTSAMPDTLTVDQIRDSSTWNLISAYEVKGTGYTAGGQILANPTLVQDDTNNWGVLHANDVTWSNTTLYGVRGVVLRVSAVTSEESDNICYLEFAENQNSVAGDFVVQWNSNGIMRAR